MIAKENVKERFLKDVKDHKLIIYKDDGLYRHLYLKNPNDFNYFYNIITFPGGLLYIGDMGTYEFERTEDMFSFFRTGIKDDNININEDYWAEKCKSKSLFGEGITEFDSDLFKKNILKQWESYFIDNLESEEALKIREEIEDQIFYGDDNEIDLMGRLYNFYIYDIETQFNITEEFYECYYMSYTHHFLWCLYAIVYAIKEYDKIKEND